MGNGIPINMLCCNQNKNHEVEEDIDIKNNEIEYIKNNKTLKIKKVELLNNKFLNYNIKPTYSVFSSENDSKKGLINLCRRDSLSNNDPNPKISLYNNTFQILNNTQQYISFSNMNFFKNNVINNNIFKPNYNPKFDSAIVNNNMEFNFVEIKTKLLLTGELFLNKAIEIDKNGMKNGLRKKGDGRTIFGYKLDNNNNINIINNNNNNTVDYLLDIKFDKIKKKRTYKENNISQVFEIFINLRQKAYFLYFLHNTLLLYYKINDFFYFELDRDYFLILGDIFLTVNVKRSLNSNTKIINCQVETENKKRKKYSYEQKDVPIKIGRENCQINIPKPSISKLHSVINFSNDHFYYKDKKSTNGSTLLIKEDDCIEIKGEMNFKLEDIPFKIREINI